MASATQSRTQVEAFLASPQKMLIEGSFVPSASGGMFDVLDPGKNEVIAQAAEGTASDVDSAVASARNAFEDGRWRRIPAPERGEILWRIGDAIDAHGEELALLESLNHGAPLSQVHSGFIQNAARCFRYYAGWADKIHGRTSDLVSSESGFHAYTLREPIGVAALIAPWNGPLLLASMKIAPALAAGCACVLKPAEETPLTALRLGRILLEAGVPAGVVNVVTGFGEPVGAALAAHSDVDLVSFTGSTEVGRLIVQAAAGNLKKLSMELGGKSPVIILDDADLSQAIPAAARAIFSLAGQVCTAGSRLFVAERHFDQVVEGVAQIGKSIAIGHSQDPRAEIGPLISAKQLQRVCGYIESGLAEGAEIVTGGSRVDSSGYFIQPTVMVKTGASMRMVREEIFGPVVAVRSFEDNAELNDLATLANDTSYGLNASIWTRDVAKAHFLARMLRSGRVGLNVHSRGDLTMPSGGYKQSGWGRESGPEGLDPYLETKSVFAALPS